MNSSTPVALITGAARRIGAHIAQTLHSAGYSVALHCRNSTAHGESLAKALCKLRPNSAAVFSADLNDITGIKKLASQTVQQWGQLDLLVNNASSFYPTPLPDCDEQQWDELMASNLKGPFFLCQALAAELTRQCGTIINIADIHGDQPLKAHPIYCIAKAGNCMMTKTLAKELAPKVRVNGIAPGAILWPEDAAELNDTQKEKILKKVPLNRPGNPEDIAQTVLFLANDTTYMTGQVIAVDGGRSATI